MGNTSSKKSEKRNKTNKQRSAPEDAPTDPAPLPPVQPDEGHHITNRDIQDAVNRGNIFFLSALVINDQGC